MNILNINQLQKTLYFLGGIILGFLIAISIKYPFKSSEMERAESICGSGQVSHITIGITGKIYNLTCKNSTTYRLSNTNGTH